MDAIFTSNSCTNVPINTWFYNTQEVVWLEGLEKVASKETTALSLSRQKSRIETIASRIKVGDITFRFRLKRKRMKV